MNSAKGEKKTKKFTLQLYLNVDCIQCVMTWLLMMGLSHDNLQMVTSENFLIYFGAAEKTAYRN